MQDNNNFFLKWKARIFIPQYSPQKVKVVKLTISILNVIVFFKVLCLSIKWTSNNIISFFPAYSYASPDIILCLWSHKYCLSGYWNSLGKLNVLLYIIMFCIIFYMFSGEKKSQLRWNFLLSICLSWFDFSSSKK